MTNHSKACRYLLIFPRSKTSQKTPHFSALAGQSKSMPSCLSTKSAGDGSSRLKRSSPAPGLVQRWFHRLEVFLCESLLGQTTTAQFLLGKGQEPSMNPLLTFNHKPEVNTIPQRICLGLPVVPWTGKRSPTMGFLAVQRSFKHWRQIGKLVVFQCSSQFSMVASEVIGFLSKSSI